MQYKKADDQYIREDSIPNPQERESYHSQFKVPFYQVIPLLVSAAHSIIQDVPRAILSTFIALTIPTSRYIIEKTRQKFLKPSTNSTGINIPKSLDERLK